MNKVDNNYQLMSNVTFLVGVESNFKCLVMDNARATKVARLIFAQLHSYTLHNV